MAQLPTKKNNDALLVALLPQARAADAEYGCFRRLTKSRTVMVTLLTILTVMIGLVAMLMQPSHAADTSSANASIATGANVSSSTKGELAIKPKDANPSKVNKPVDNKFNWEDLTAAQKQTLAPLSSGWKQLKLSTRKKWLEVSRRYAHMSQAEQTRVQERMHDWVNLTPEQRRLVRENYARNRQLDTEQRAKRWAEYQQLPEAEKQKLAAEAAAANNRKRVTSQILSPPAATKSAKPIQLTPKPALAPASAVDAIGH